MDFNEISRIQCSADELRLYRRTWDYTEEFRMHSNGQNAENSKTHSTFFTDSNDSPG